VAREFQGDWRAVQGGEASVGGMEAVAVGAHVSCIPGQPRTSIVCRVSVPVAEVVVVGRGDLGFQLSSSRLLGGVAAVGHSRAPAILIPEFALQHVQQKQQ